MSYKRLKSGCYRVMIPLYGRAFYLSFAKEDSEFITKHYTIDLSGDFHGMVKEHETDPPLMLILGRTHNTIAHEIQHLLLIILNKIGSYADYDNQEPSAYLAGYIAEQVYECMDDWLKRRDAATDKG